MSGRSGGNTPSPPSGKARQPRQSPAGSGARGAGGYPGSPQREQSSGGRGGRGAGGYSGSPQREHSSGGSVGRGAGGYPWSPQRGQARQPPESACKVTGSGSGGSGSGSGEPASRDITLGDFMVFQPSRKKKGKTSSDHVASGPDPSPPKPPKHPRKMSDVHISSTSEASDSDATSENPVKLPGKKSDIEIRPTETIGKTEPIATQCAKNEEVIGASASEDSIGSSSSGNAGLTTSKTPPGISFAARVGDDHTHTSARDEVEKLKILFKDFLDNSTGGKNFPYYKAMRKIMAECKHYTLTVDFLHIMKEEKWMPLAVAIVNDRNKEHGWLRAVAYDFITAEFQVEDKHKFALNFTNNPESLNPLKNMISLNQLVKRVTVFRRKSSVRVATAHGRHLFLCLLLHILDMHEQGLSWNGEFVLEDIYILSSSDGTMKCWVTRPTNNSEDPLFPPSCTDLEKVKDLVKLDAILTSYYKEDGVLPLYFIHLSNALQAISRSQVQNPRFLLFLKYHPAFMSSSARKFLIRNLHNDIRAFKLASHPDFFGIFGVHPARDSWLDTIVDDSHPVIKGVRSHKYDDSGKSEKSKKSENSDKYVNTAESLLAFIRNVLDHAFEHLDAAGSGTDDSDEAELFISHIFYWFLPMLLLSLLSNDLMTGILRKTWSGFTSMRSDMSAPGK